MSDYKSASQAVFVSSTFRDMQSERDMLRDYVLPRVNEFASAYGNTIELIDLRWGIDTDGISEAEQNNKVLRSCLEEIRRSRPFFIGLLGDRYGWIPPEKDMSAALALENYKTDDLNKSVTALEIEYGSLKAEFPPVSLFYFREMDLSRLDEKALGIYRDGDETARKRHQSLKALIKKTYPGLVKTYKAETKDGYVSGLNEFAEMAAKDIINALREKWGEPPAAPPMEYDREFKAQAAFRQRHLQTYADRKADGIDYVKELCEFALSENTEHFAAVFGKSGSGKSALICKVMEELERKHGDKCLVLGYSCGLTPNGGNAAGMLRYFIIRLADYLGMDIKKQADYIASYIGSYMPSLKLYFFRLLAAAAEKTRVVVVADAIERFMESGEDPMIWSSGMPNKNLAIILSSGDENELYKNKYTLTGVGRAALPFVIQKIAAQYHKQVPQPVINHLAGQTPEGGYLPLYLHMLVLNMTMINRREQVIIDSYAAQGYTPMQAISAYMIEWIVDFEPLPVDEMFFDLISRASGITDSFFAKAVLGAIAVSADGLREKDLKGIFDEMGAEWSSVDFAILRQILRGALIQGDELQWKFAHRLLESAYWQRGLDNIKAMSGYVRDYMLKNTGDDFIAGCILPQLYVTGQSEEALTVIIADEGRHTEAFRRCLAKVLFTQKLNPGEASFIEKILAKALESRESGRNCRAVSALFGAEFFERIPGDFNWDKRDINLLSTALKLIPEDENDDDVRENKAMLHYILAERYYGYGRAENNLTDIFNNYSLSASARISLLNKHETEERLRDCVLSISGFIGFIAKEMNITDAVANIFEAYTSILIEYANRLKQMTACDHNFLAIMESYKSLIWAMDKMRQYDYVPQLADEGIAFCVKCYEYSRMTEFLAMASDIAKVAAESCRRLGKTELAERYYSTGVDFARTIVSDLESGTRLTSLTRDTALFYIESKDFKKAYEYMASVLEFSKELSAVYESHRTIMDSVITRVMYAEICALNGLMEQGLAEAQDVKKLIIDKMNDTAEKEADKWFSRAINVIDYIKNQVGIS